MTSLSNPLFVASSCSRRWRSASAAAAAAIGALAVGGMRRLGPLGLLLGGGYAAKKAYDRHKANKAASGRYE